MSDVLIRTEGRAGRITLNRPKALNALTPAMCRAIDAALIAWAEDPAVAVVLIDAGGERAFCAGGDIAEVYRSGSAGDLPCRATSGARNTG
jgi:enoyl-CoA hydratase